MKFRAQLIIYLLLTINTFGQKKIDAVYLVNGSIIKGRIIEQTGEIIKIETCCGSIFAYKPDEVSEIKQEDVQKTKTLKDKGYYNLTSLGVLTGTGPNEKEAPLSLMMEHIYRMNSYTSIGGIIGFETLNEAILPIGASLRGILPLGRGGAAYIGFIGGYSISLEKPPSDYTIVKAKGGTFFNPEIGYLAPTGGNGSFFMAIGYRHNTLNYEREDYYFTDPVERKQIYNRLSVKIGICFQ